MNLNQVTIPVTNVERSILFYEQLGLRLIVRSLPQYARFVCPDGDGTFSLHQAAITPAESQVWIYFETANVDGYVETLVSKGILFDEMPADKPWLWREARLKDPDGNQLIIYHAGSNRKDPPWRIS